MMSIINCFKSAEKYISEADTFLCLFDQRYPNKSQSQQKEIEAYQQLFYQRDNKIKTIKTELST